METAPPLLTILSIIDCSMLEKFSLDSSQKNSCIYLFIYLLSLVLPHLTPSSQTISLHIPAGSYQVPVRSPLLHAEWAPFPWPLFTWEMLQPLIILVTPPLNSLQFTNVFFLLRHVRHHWCGITDADASLPWVFWPCFNQQMHMQSHIPFPCTTYLLHSFSTLFPCL